MLNHVFEAEVSVTPFHARGYEKLCDKLGLSSEVEFQLNDLVGRREFSIFALGKGFIIDMHKQTCKGYASPSPHQGIHVYSNR